jgi:diadenosine tetraphosphate (Ap4A) HIT family hydrolase
MEDFSKYTIKEYKYWTVLISYNQNYLGKCILWCKREDALDLADATEEERSELFTALKELKKAERKAFQPDWFDYSFLGNSTRHLHCHFVPRYNSPRVIEGVTFEDKLAGHNWQTDNDFKISDDLLNRIKLILTEALN